jgi:hypothetical protein
MDGFGRNGASIGKPRARETQQSRTSIKLNWGLVSEREMSNLQ